MSSLFSPRIALPALGALAIFATVMLVYMHSVSLSRQLDSARQELAIERQLVEMQQETIDDLQDHYEALARRLNRLNAERARVDREVSDMRRALEALNLAEEMSRDPDVAADLLRDRSRQLNRMLESASDFGSDR